MSELTIDFSGFGALCFFASLVSIIVGAYVGFTQGQEIDEHRGQHMAQSLREVFEPAGFKIISWVLFLGLGNLAADLLIQNFEWMKDLFGFGPQVFFGFGITFLVLVICYNADLVVKLQVGEQALLYFQGQYVCTVGRSSGLIGRIYVPLVPFLFTLENQVDMKERIIKTNIGKPDDGVPFRGSIKGACYHLLVGGQVESALYKAHITGNFAGDLNAKKAALGAGLISALDIHQVQRLIFFLSQVVVDHPPVAPGALRPAPDVHIRGDVPGEVTDNSLTPAEDALMRREHLPKLLGFVVFCRDHLGYLVTSFGAEDVNVVDQETEKQIEAAMRAQFKHDQDVTEAPGIAARKAAEAAGDVARTNAQAGVVAALPRDLQVLGDAGVVLGNRGGNAGGGNQGGGGNRGGGGRP